MHTRGVASTAIERTTRPDGMPLRAVVVDDEASLSDLVRMALKYEGWEVRVADTGQSALREIREFKPDAVVLDIMLPDLDGLEVLQRIRADGDDVPVLFLTAKDTVADRVTGLTVGGDDYVTKPFSLEELIARLRALVRRSSAAPAQESSLLRVGELTLDEDSYEVEFRGEPVQLTATEFELLRFLMRNERRVMSKAQILDRVWSYDFNGRASIVELYISTLRKKLGPEGAALIHTVRGFGYAIRADR